MTKESVQRDLLFAANLAAAVLTAVAVWEVVQHTDMIRDMKARGYRTVAREAKKLAEKSSSLAAQCDTAYWTTIQG
jgi:hypothetical protein